MPVSPPLVDSKCISVESLIQYLRLILQKKTPSCQGVRLKINGYHLNLKKWCPFKFLVWVGSQGYIIFLLPVKGGVILKPLVLKSYSILMLLASSVKTGRESWDSPASKV